jgi:hypothetical protein
MTGTVQAPTAPIARQRLSQKAHLCMAERRRGEAIVWGCVAVTTTRGDALLVHRIIQLHIIPLGNYGRTCASIAQRCVNPRSAGLQALKTYFSAPLRRHP